MLNCRRVKQRRRAVMMKRIRSCFIPWRRRHEFAVTVMMILLITIPGYAEDSTSGCRPGSRTARAGSPPGPGTYRLTMVAEIGSRAGSTADGTLWLIESGTGQDRRLYGGTDLNLPSVGAVVDNDPPASSRNAEAPGVLLWRDEMLLSVSTFSNISRPGIVRHGPGGTGLWVRERSESGFSGTWRSLGHVNDGAGYYCAVRIVP